MGTAANEHEFLPDHADAARVALLGHDLRAAVSDVIGGLRLIDHTGLDANTRLQLERVQAAGEALARLLESELALLQGEGSLDDPVNGNVHTTRLLNDLKMRWAGKAQEKGLGFALHVAPGVPQVLSLDRMALDRVMSNLLSNAVKYTDRGMVRLNVDLLPDETLRFVVADDGPGFSDRALSSVFIGGARPDGRGKPGLGLGLRITKDMTDRLKGTIVVCNAETGGAVATVLLPRAAWLPGGPPSGIKQSAPDLTNIRVLLADDSPTNQAIIGNMLASLGAEYEIASDGVEAMHWLDRERFDIALLDIEMPRLSGLEVLRILRAQTGDTAKMPVLAITAYVLRANREAIYAAGADGLLAKPVLCVQSFGAAIQRVLARKNQPAHSLAADPVLLPPDSAGLVLDRGRFDHLMTLSGPVGAIELLSRLTTDLQQVERGLVRSISDGTLSEVRAHTHVLISLAGAVGAGPLQHLAQRMNDAAHNGTRETIDLLAGFLLPQLDQLIHFVFNERVNRQQATV